LYSGSETNVQVRRESEIRTPTAAQPPQSIPAPATQNPAPVSQNSAPASPTTNPAGTTGATASVAAPTEGSQAPRIRFEPQGLTLKAGETTTVGIVVDNVSDLYSIPLLLQYNPAVVSVEEVQHGGFLSGGTQEIAIVSRVDKEHGQAIISATRQPNTPGVNGSGTLMGIVIKGVAAGTSNLSIVQVNAKDSQQKPIPLVTSEATLQVQP
jgi:general secretion pathway protein D